MQNWLPSPDHDEVWPKINCKKIVKTPMMTFVTRIRLTAVEYRGCRRRDTRLTGGMESNTTACGPYRDQQHGPLYDEKKPVNKFPHTSFTSLPLQYDINLLDQGEMGVMRASRKPDLFENFQIVDIIPDICHLLNV